MVNIKEVLSRIYNIIPSDKKIVLIDVYDKDTGVIIESGIPIFKNDIFKRKNNIKKIPKTPYIKLSAKGENIVENKYLKNFSRTEKGYLFDLFRSVDSYGRIKYGENYQQYCRNMEDFAKVLDTSYETLRRSLIPKLKKYDLIRVVDIKKGSGYTDETYISFNPVLITNGVYWDRWTLITWLDVVKEFELLSSKNINNILGKH